MADMRGCYTDATTVRQHTSVVVILTIVSTLLHFPSVSGQRPCTSQNCLPPNCFCKGGRIPGDLPVADTPQLVMLTFDDAVNNANFPQYQQLYADKINPNGCPVRGTFYVCHDYSNYQMIQTLYNQGHEIASHSISHRLPQGWWSWASPAEWASEIEGQRQILSLWASIPKSQIRGMRAPYLAVGGDSQFQMISNLLGDNFVYDASLVSSAHRRSAFISPSWPYTMDYPPTDECLIPPCPSTPFPGVWEIPLDSTQGLNSQWCSMADECTPGMSETQVYNYFLDNLNRHYTSNRAPFGVYLHGPWLDDPAHFRALDRFISDVSARGDVYFVTAWQVIQWMRNPVSLSQLRNNFCPLRQNSAPCNDTQANFCLFDGGANRVNRKKRSVLLDELSDGKRWKRQATPSLNGTTVSNTTTDSETSVDNSTVTNATSPSPPTTPSLGKRRKRQATSSNNSTVNGTANSNVTTDSGTTLDNLAVTNTTGPSISASQPTTPSLGKRRKRQATPPINNSILNGTTNSNTTTDSGTTLDNSTVANTTGPSLSASQSTTPSLGKRRKRQATPPNTNSTVNGTTNYNATNVGLGQAGNGSSLDNSTVTSNATDPFAALAQSRNPEKFDLKYLKLANQARETRETHDRTRTRSSRRKRQAYNGWHNMYTCTPCPQSYPWIGNPLGL